MLSNIKVDRKYGFDVKIHRKKTTVYFYHIIECRVQF